MFSWRGAGPAAMFDASGGFNASAENPLISARTLALLSFFEKDLNAGHNHVLGTRGSLEYEGWSSVQ